MHDSGINLRILKKDNLLQYHIYYYFQYLLESLTVYGVFCYGLGSFMLCYLFVSMSVITLNMVKTKTKIQFKYNCFKY